MLSGFWDSVKHTASALVSAWHRIANFKPKNIRFNTGVFDDDGMINIPEQAFKVNVFLGL